MANTALPRRTRTAAAADVDTTTGDVKIMGLKSGKYTLKETGFVERLCEELRADLHRRTDREPGEPAKSTFKLVGANNLGLASRLDEGMSDKAIQVKNVKNVTQLPLTGAMGTALFTIAALVMAGAGLALVLRFRESDTPMAV